jgi:5-methylcytosine-specific restriction endonuclease McrA
MLKCLRCNKSHDGSFGSGKYCSIGCSNSRGPRSAEFKSKVSKKMSGVSPWNVGKKLSESHKEKISKSLFGKEKNKSGKYSNENVFVENSSYARHHIKKRILKEKLIEYKCQCCGLGNLWNQQKLVLQLDHINSVNNDHRLENLRFVCPNCHTQQHTYAAKNRFNIKRQSKKYT